MSRNRSSGIPPTSILAGGITRHGPLCSCVYCTPGLTVAQRQAIGRIEQHAGGVLQPPIRSTATIDDVFSATRETVAKLEAEHDARDAKRLVHVGGEWSPSQFVRAAS